MALRSGSSILPKSSLAIAPVFACGLGKRPCCQPTPTEPALPGAVPKRSADNHVYAQRRLSKPLIGRRFEMPTTYSANWILTPMSRWPPRKPKASSNGSGNRAPQGGLLLRGLAFLCQPRNQFRNNTNAMTPPNFLMTALLLALYAAAQAATAPKITGHRRLTADPRSRPGAQAHH